MRKHVSHNIRLRISIFAACIISACFTYMALDHAAKAGAKYASERLASDRNSTPDYVRYAAMGYAFDTVSSKKNILISITDGELLSRCHLFVFDCDKKTLDILELPVQTLISTDGFDGTVQEAYETSVYKDIISRALVSAIDNVIEMDKDSFSACCSLLGGIKIRIDSPVTIGEVTLSKGTRTLAGSVAGLIASDSGAYISGDSERVNIYRRMLASFISGLDDRGALNWFGLLMNVIVNGMKSDMNVSELTELVNLCESISLDRIRLWLLPGYIADNDVYTADIDVCAELLNSYFRVKGVSVESDGLGLAWSEGAYTQYDDMESKIKQILK